MPDQKAIHKFSCNRTLYGELAACNCGLEKYITKTGRVLTDKDFERLADEAEEGYDLNEGTKE